MSADETERDEGGSEGLTKGFSGLPELKLAPAIGDMQLYSILHEIQERILTIEESTKGMNEIAKKKKSAGLDILSALEAYNAIAEQQSMQARSYVIKSTMLADKRIKDLGIKL